MKPFGFKFVVETKKKKHIFTFFNYYGLEDSKELKGFTNKCSDSQYITCLDYDGGWELDDVEANKTYLEEKWGIKFRYIFKTNKGFHLISLCKVSFNYLREIYADSLADPSFVKVPFITTLHSSTLRISEKRGKYPELIKQYPFGESDFIQSHGHYEMLRVAYNGLLKPKGKFDDTSIVDVQVVTYWSKP